MDVYIEHAAKRSFACAVAFPGWARSGRTEEAALEALLDYRDRYAAVAGLAGVEVPDDPEPVVVERVPGNATTEFGAPAIVPDLDRAALSQEELERRLTLLRAVWAYLDEVVATAPAVLRKGPRGGGRDRDEVLAHVVNAERAYARKVGVSQPPFDPRDHGALAAFRSDQLRGLAVASEPAWPVGYAIRRIAWHAADHAWEIEDRSA